MTAAPTPTFAPWWWERVPRPVLPAAPIPRECDVAIVGSGYTGLHAALVTARAGRHTLVFDAEDAGFGCSTRNGGQISTSVKPSFAALAKRHGEKRAFEIMKEGQRSLAFVGDFVRNEAIDCDFGVVGRFHAAHNPAQYEALAKSVSAQPRGWRFRRTSCRAPNSAPRSTPTPTTAASSTKRTRRSTRRATTRACSSG